MNRQPTRTRHLPVILIALTTASSVTAQTEPPPQTAALEATQVNGATSAAPLARQTANERGIRDSLNGLETRMTSIERRMINVENSVRGLRLEVDILGRRVERLESSMERLEARVVALEHSVNEMNDNLVRLQALITSLVELHTSEDAAPR